MNLEKLKKEELELLSFTDLTEMILKDSKKSMNTPTIFKKICSILGLSDEEYQAKIGDYYTSLTTDKRFLLLDNAEWDLKDRHKIEIVIDEDEDEAEESLETMEEENIDEDTMEEENIDEDILDDESLDDEDDLEDLSIISDEETDEE